MTEVAVADVVLTTAEDAEITVIGAGKIVTPVVGVVTWAVVDTWVYVIEFGFGMFFGAAGGIELGLFKENISGSP